MATLRVILRGLGRTPGFTLTAILSLALGIGANTAIFSLLDQVLLRMLPVKNPRELVFLYSPGPTQGHYSSDESGGPSFTYPVFRELEKQQTPFTGLAAARRAAASVATGFLSPVFPRLRLRPAAYQSTNTLWFD